VLQDVFDSLRSAFQSASTKKKKKGGKSKVHRVPDVEEAISNIYEYLELLQEPQPSDSDGAETAATSTESTPSSEPVYELDTAEEDEALHVWSLLQDLADIRAGVRLLWSDYHQGKVSILLALRVTEVAGLLISDLDSAFTKAHPRLNGIEAIARFIGLNIAHAGHAVSARTQQGEGSDDGTADLFCVSAWNTLF